MAMIMTNDTQAHPIAIEAVEPVPPEVAVGSDFVLKVKVSCPAGCDLSDVPVTITAPDGVVTTLAPEPAHAGTGETRDIALQAPLRVGEQRWGVRFGPH
jgi:hypothetical protein